ncbi:unnamed protein product, partial [Prorocentrum cordatum]
MPASAAAPCGSRSSGEGMDWAIRGLQAVAALAPYLLPPRCPDCSCVADCSTPTEIVGLLGRQLGRCGPEQVTCPVCPSCPELRCPAPGPAPGAFAAGAAIGALAAALAKLAWRLRQPALVAIDFFDDPNGFKFHVRALLVPAGASSWIWATLDHGEQFGDFTTHLVAPPRRNAPFLRRPAGQLRAFDPFEEGELEAVWEQAAALAAALGIEVPRGAAAAPPLRAVADAAHPQFGQAHDAAVSGAEYRRQRPGVPRAEVAARVPDRRAGLSPGIAGHANHYTTSSGMPPSSAAAHAIRPLFEALRRFIEHDQVDVTNLARAELIARRIAQMQRAIRRNPKHPDYSSLEGTSASALDETGGAANRKFDERVAQEQKTKVVTTKNTRVYTEERDAEDKRPLYPASILEAGPPAANDLLGGCRSFAPSFVPKAFVQEKAPLLQGSVEPREAFDLVPDHVRQVLIEPERFLERHSDELMDEPHIEPYCDPLLNPRVRANHPRLLAQLRRLADVGTVAATRQKKAIAGLFFVEKKGDRLRAIAGSPTSSTDWRRRYSASSNDAALRAATADLKDGFHQLKIPHLSERFVFDVPGARAMDLGAQQVYDGDVGSFVEAAPDDYAWPANGGPATGWPWALWICHETPARATRSPAGTRDAMALDKVLAARLEQGMVGDPPHVDNANIIRVERDLAQARLERMTAVFDLPGLKWHERQDAGAEAAGWQIRAVLGHLVSFFQLLGLGPPVFRVLRDFAQQDLGEIRELPTAALHELRVARSLLVMAVGRWGLPPYPVAFMTNAPMKGYAPLETDTTPDEVHEFCRRRERACCSRRERFVEREHDGFKGSLAIGDASEGWRDGQLERARPRGPVPERCRVEVDSGWRPPPLPDNFADPTRRELVVAGAWRDASRIQDYEARCGLMGLARAASYPPYHDAELLSAGDSMGSALAFEEGRAANGELT